MKYIRILCGFALIATSAVPLNASSITAYNNQTAYVTTNHVFRNNEVAQGFVRLNEGFTVMPHSCVTMDVVLSVSGDIDLHETSTIRLLKDLEFDSGVTLTTGGNIDGRGHTVIFNGNFRIPDGKVLHFNGDTIIDAHGHEIVIGENAEIFVDTNVTLTIANAVIKSLRNVPTCPVIRCSALTSKLALDNVIFAPADDFLFQSGQLFIHNDVVITGTSAFVYHSPVPSFIAKNSCLYVDHDVTFSLAPATFTDAPYALKNTYTDCNFIRMADETASLFFNGCTVQITDTGFHFAQGTLTLDDRVAIKTDPTLTLTSLSLRAQYDESSYSIVYGLAWSPDGHHIAIITNGGSFEIFSFDGVSLTRIVQLAVGSSVGVAWSPDGKYLAVNANPYTKIYRFNGSSVTFATQTDTGGSMGLAWSHDGKFLATASDPGLKVYAFDGTSLTFIDQQSGGYFGVAWSPNDRYIMHSAFDEYAYLYEFNGKSLTLKVTLFAGGGSSTTSKWSPDGRYVVVAWDDAKMGLFRFDGNSLIPIADIISSDLLSADWSPDGNYVVVGFLCPDPSEVSILKVYKFDSQSLTLIPATQMDFTSEYGALFYTVGWSPDGKYVAAARSNGANLINPELHVYTADYSQTTTTQALTNSFVLGDSAKGENYDAHLRLQPGASLNLTGKMLYDNVS